MEPRIIQRFYLVPIIMGVGMALGMITCFLVALSTGDVSAYVPMISETGAKPPESGILGLVLTFGAFLGTAVMTVRFLLVSELNSGHSKKIDIFNIFSLVIGYLSLVGMIIVAVYPMSTVMAAHIVGAMLVFFGGAAYGFLQSLITYWMYPTHNGIAIFRIRLGICLAFLTFLILMTVVFPFGIKLWNSKHAQAKKTPDDKGFAEILTSALCEWLAAFSSIIFFLTYVREFRKVTFRFTTVFLVSHFDDEVDERQIQQA